MQFGYIIYSLVALTGILYEDLLDYHFAFKSILNR